MTNMFSYRLMKLKLKTGKTTRIQKDSGLFNLFQ